MNIRYFPDFIVRDYQPEDWVEIEKLEFRKDGLASINEMKGITQLDALRGSIENSEICRVLTTRKSGDIFLIYGAAAAPDHPDIGLPWLMATKKIHLYKLEVVRETRRVIAEDFLSRFKHLRNVMDKERQDVLKFAKMVGFHITDIEIPYMGRTLIVFALDRGSD